MAITYRVTKGSALDYAEMDENFQTLEDKDTAQDADIANVANDIANVALAKMGGDAFMHVQDQKPQGVYGGGFSSGAWRTRTLNTILTNTILGASLDNNQVTLPAGRYYIEASAPAFAVERHKTRIQEITAGSELLVGSSERNRVGSDRTSNLSYVRGMVELSLGGTLELQHYCTTSNTSEGFGFQVSVTTEVYSDIRIWRVGDYVAP